MAGEQRCRKGPGGAGDSRLSVSQQCALAAKGAGSPWGVWDTAQPAAPAAPVPAFSVAAASPCALCAVLGPTISEGCEGP